VLFLGRADCNALTVMFPYKLFAEAILSRGNFSATEC